MILGKRYEFIPFFHFIFSRRVGACPAHQRTLAIRRKAKSFNICVSQSQSSINPDDYVYSISPISHLLIQPTHSLFPFHLLSSRGVMPHYGHSRFAERRLFILYVILYFTFNHYHSNLSPNYPYTFYISPTSHHIFIK
jgi:hypothetical protein